MKKMNKTQQKILKAAKEVYYEVGYSGSTFQMIAERSDTSRSLINYYYPKKQDILVCLLGNFLDSIHDYVRQLNRYDSLMTFMLTYTIYTMSMFVSEQTRNFNLDVLHRSDRDLGPYKNYTALYVDIVKEFNINLSEEDLLYKEIAIFGASTELLINYYNNNISVSEEKLLELLLREICHLLLLSSFTINNAIANLWNEYRSLECPIFPLFDQPILSALNE
ncbi:MAG: TetR/AcrR family transcriptional regulator [Anaerofustis sp.]